MTRLKIGIVGSRSRNSQKDKNRIRRLLSVQINKGRELMLISGGCSRGADRFAEELAVEFRLEMTVFPPAVEGQTSKQEYAIAAFIRNTLIAENCHMLLAVWDGNSKGTKDTINKVKALNKPVILL